MGTVAAATVALAVLAAAGAVPTVVLTGFRWTAVPAAPLAGAVLAALAATGCLAVGGAVLPWFVALAAIAWVGTATAWWFRRPTRRARSALAQLSGSSGSSGGTAGLAGLVVVAGATAWWLLALRAPTVGFDARAIWFLHADWFAGGHRVALAALRNPALPYAHQTYPPLVGGSVAVSWLVTGDHGYRLGQVMVALLNGCALATAALAVVEVGVRSGRANIGWRAWCPAGVAVVVAGALVLATAGVTGIFATNGLADLLWSSAAVGAVGFGLVLTGRGHDLGMAALLVAVAGLTKDEGIPLGMAVVVLMTLRSAWPFRSDLRRLWRPLAAGASGVLALGGWPALVDLLGPPPAFPGSGSPEGVWFRVEQTYDGMAGHLHVVLLALVVSALGWVFLRRGRRSAGLGNDGWGWAAMAAGIGAVAVTYVTGTLEIRFWLLTSVNRTIFFPAILAWWIVGIWAVVASGHLVAPPAVPIPPEPAEPLPLEPLPLEPEPLDGGPALVLHNEP
ncbi:MAG TPA: hypothetical protein VHW47_02665 [Acidimicrobiales bacterium]|jgi:hypothetical protein|nr:hypothetical protein [Acidimicrobiales bacterium]